MHPFHLYPNPALPFCSSDFIYPSPSIDPQVDQAHLVSHPPLVLTILYPRQACFTDLRTLSKKIEHGQQLPLKILISPVLKMDMEARFWFRPGEGMSKTPLKPLDKLYAYSVGFYFHAASPAGPLASALGSGPSTQSAGEKPSP